MSRSCRIHLQPDDVHLDIAHGRTLLLGLADHGVFLRSDCGGRGICKKCRVSVEEDGHDIHRVEACSFLVTENLTVQVSAFAGLPSCILAKAPLLLPESFDLHQPESSAAPHCGMAIDLGITSCRAGVQTLPLVSGFIGADTLAAGLTDFQKAFIECLRFPCRAADMGD